MIRKITKIQSLLKKKFKYKTKKMKNLTFYCVLIAFSIIYVSNAFPKTTRPNRNTDFHPHTTAENEYGILDGFHHHPHTTGSYYE